MNARVIRPDLPVSLARTLGPVCRGPGDPSMRVSRTQVWRATRTPDGAVTVHLTAADAHGGGGALAMRAWGPGAAWALERFPDLVGAGDGAAGFAPKDAVVAELARRVPGLRIGRTGAVLEALVPTIIEQKVVGLEARRSYARLVRALGEPAPPADGMPPGLTVPPAPDVLARTPPHTYHRFGIERRRADTIRVAASYAHRLEEAASLSLAEAYRRLRALPGVGPWSAAEVGLVAFGDADAVSVGDYHLPHQVAYALAGEPRADDARMLALLEPYRGHRGRVIRLVEAAGPAPPRFGPRLSLQSIASL